MKKYILLSLAALLAAVSCNKELESTPAPQENTVTLTAVVEDNLTKSYLNSDNYVCWADGDQVWINGNTYTVHVNGTVVTIPGVTSASTYACVYPAGIASDFSDGSKVRITLPQNQAIIFDAQLNQILSLPMAAYGDGSTPLKFRNLCGLVSVAIDNPSYASITPKSMTLTTSGDGDFIAPLYGKTDAKRDLSSTQYDTDWAVLASNIGSSTSVEKRTLNITFPDNFTLTQNSGRIVYVTVPVIDNGTKSNLSLTIDGTLPSGNNFKFQRTTGSTKQIGRNQIGNIPVSSTMCYEITTGTMKGDGSASDPWQISTKEQFLAFCQMVENNQVTADSHFLQVCDIDFNGAEIPTVGCRLDAYSTYDRPFKGTYDGGNHSLSNFKVKYEERIIEEVAYLPFRYALFPYVDGGTIKNLVIDNSFTFSGSVTQETFVAGVVAEMKGGSLENVKYKGKLDFSLTGKYAMVGGIVAEASSATLSNITFDATLTASSDPYDSSRYPFGGIVADAKSNSSLNNCTVSAASVLQAKGFAYAGGVCGYLINSSITYCSFGGKLQPYGSERTNIGCIGGIVGYVWVDSNNPASIENLVVSHLITLEGASINFPRNLSKYTDIDKTKVKSTDVGGIFGQVAIISPFNANIESLENNAVIEIGIEGDSDGKIDMQNVRVGGIFGCMIKDQADVKYMLSSATNKGAITISTKLCPASLNTGGIGGYVNAALTSDFIGSYANTGSINVTLGSDYHDIMSSSILAGGLFGYMYATGFKFTFQDCSNSGDVTANQNYGYAYVGGLAGKLDGTGYVNLIDKFVNKGAIAAYTYAGVAYVGGVIGTNDDRGTHNTIAQIFNSANLGAVIGRSNSYEVCAGGFFGNNNSNGGGALCPCVINSFNRGNISATCIDNSANVYIGGIIGYGCDDWTWVSATYSYCDLYCGGYNNLNCGGLSGYNAGHTDLSYWYYDESHQGVLHPIAAIHPGNDDTVGNKSLPDASTMNTQRAAVTGIDGYSAAFPDSPTFLEWTTAQDGKVVLSGLSL